MSISPPSLASEAVQESDPSIYEGDFLCEKCSVLRIDDAKLGGHKGTYWGRSRAPGSVLKLDADDRPRKIPLDYSHEDDWPQLPRLKVSAEKGCVFCRALRLAILSASPHPFMRDGIEVRLEYTWKSRANENNDPRNPYHGLNALTASIFARGEGSSENDDDVLTTLVFVVEQGTYGVGDWLQLEPGVSDNPFDPENLAMIRRHINGCERLCSHVKKTKESEFIPTRLLDLDAPNTPDGICLIETANAGFSECPRYAALSYCWGKKKDADGQLKSTTESLKDHLSSIAWGSLTHVIRDAVTVARALSVRYLWVDALCIVQGDHLDWEHESGRMRLLFGNAYFTIAGIASNSCHESFLNRQKAISIGFRSAVDPKIIGYYKIRHHPMLPRFKRYNNRRWYKSSRTLDELGSRYATRAWTLQEQELSSRILCFGSSKIYFQCSSFQSVEPFNQSLCKLLQTEMRFALTIQDALDEGQPIGFIYAEWLNLITQTYSLRKCALRQDRLPAISGLASCIAEATEDEYVAGVFRGDLTRGLIWHCNYPTHKSVTALVDTFKSPRTYVAPSWSWATQTRNIRYPVIRVPSTVPRMNYNYDCREPWEPDPRDNWEYEPREECFDIEAITILEDSSTDKFGRLKDGYLTLTGKIAKVASSLRKVERGPLQLPCWRAKTENGYTVFCNVDWAIWEDEYDELDMKNMVLLMLLSTTSRTDYDDYLNSHVGVEDNEEWEGVSEEDNSDKQRPDTAQSLRDEAMNGGPPPFAQAIALKDAQESTSSAPATTSLPVVERESEDLVTLQNMLPPTRPGSPLANQHPEILSQQLSEPPSQPPPEISPPPPTTTASPVSLPTNSSAPTTIAGPSSPSAPPRPPTPAYPTLETVAGLSNVPLPYNPASTPEENKLRQAWGLLLYPTGRKTGKGTGKEDEEETGEETGKETGEEEEVEEYVRVGVFTCRRRFGGMGAFEGVGVKRVRVV